ncbi:hypothetical protein TSOC111612_01390 [Tsukamurella ocularis]|uniref:hypothetical protein n=1 Tax=Tsukamurella ocularis TaxID=1970234 RepID=UPI0039F11F9E
MADDATTALPIHPVTGLRALGVTRRGPVWPAIGGSGEGDGNTGDTPTGDGADSAQNAGAAKPEPQGAEQQKATDDKVDWKAKYEETLAHARKHEQRAKDNKTAADELAQIKAAQMSEQEKAEAATKAANERAEAAERRAAIRDAVIDHGLTKDDIELLEDVPADKIADRAKKLAARTKAAGAGASGAEHNGTQRDLKPTSLRGALAAHYSR